MLDIIAVEKTFNPGTVNEKKALNGIDLHLDDGDFVTVIGGNGAGKSTMLNMIAGVYPVDCGRIVVDGVDVTRLPEHKRAKYLGRVFQDPMTGTAADMQIEENLALAARRGQFRGLRAGITSKERKEFKEILKILDLGLEERLTAKVGLLSGGQRQALALIIATMSDIDLLILDDLGTEFSSQFTVSCLYNLFNTRKNRGLATIISTNLSADELVAKYDDRIYSRIVGKDYDIFVFNGKDFRL